MVDLDKIFKVGTLVYMIILAIYMVAIIVRMFFPQRKVDVRLTGLYDTKFKTRRVIEQPAQQPAQPLAQPLSQPLSQPLAQPLEQPVVVQPSPVQQPVQPLPVTTPVTTPESIELTKIKESNKKLEQLIRKYEDKIKELDNVKKIDEVDVDVPVEKTESVTISVVKPKNIAKRKAPVKKKRN